MRIFLYFFLLNISLFSNSVFISEYVQAQQSNNSYLEIYNGTDSVVDLSEYSIKITQSNGNEYDLNLNDASDDSINDGTLGPGDILLIVKLIQENYVKKVAIILNVQKIMYNLQNGLVLISLMEMMLLLYTIMLN